MTNLYLFARKVHRLLVLIITSLALIMIGTGSLLKYPQLAAKLNINFQIVRYIHNQVSPFLSITLILVAGSGIYMYFYLAIKQKQN